MIDTSVSELRTSALIAGQSQVTATDAPGWNIHKGDPARCRNDTSQRRRSIARRDVVGGLWQSQLEGRVPEPWGKFHDLQDVMHLVVDNVAHSSIVYRIDHVVVP